jgi:hypothetical protein
MRRLAKYCWLLLAMILLGGCGPKIAEEELGELVFDYQQLPGYGEEYPLRHLPSEHEEMRQQMGGRMPAGMGP